MKAKTWMGVFVAVAFAGTSGCHHRGEKTEASDPALAAYDTEADWTDAQRVIPLDYQQAQGKQVFYEQCVWCHADATPAGPSNRSNLTPVPPLLNDGAALNSESNERMQQIITLGGAAVGKSAMMPPYGRTLSAEDIRAVISFARAIAQPAYQPGAPAGPQSPAAK